MDNAVSDLISLVSTLSYKPGWEFYIFNADPYEQAEGLEESPGKWTLAIKLEGADINDRTKPTVLAITFPAPDYALGRSDFWNKKQGYDRRAMSIQWLFACVMELEKHEAREWFQVSADRVFNPHAGGPTYNQHPSFEAF